MKLLIGDIFTIKVDENRIGFGQVVALPQKNILIIAVFDKIANIDQKIDCSEIVNAEVLFLGCTLDAKLYHKHWNIVGNICDNITSISLPYNILGTAPEIYLTDYMGNRLRKASNEEIKLLDYETIIAPVRYENALKAHFGIQEWHADYDKLLYRRIIQAKKLIG